MLHKHSWHTATTRIKTLIKQPKYQIIGVFIILCSMIVYQQIQISILQERVDLMNEFKDTSSFAYRIWELEYIVSSHSSSLKELQPSVKELNKEWWIIQDRLNEYQWRIMQLEWHNTP